MSKHGIHGLWNLVRDLWRELTPIVGCCLFAGVALGLSLGLVFVLRLPPDYGRLVSGNRIQYRTILVPRLAIVLVTAFLGGLVGTASGVVTEIMFGRPEGIAGKKRRRRHTGLFRDKE
jgi:hypothetical protein